MEQPVISKVQAVKMLKAIEACFKSVRTLIMENAGKAKFTEKADGSPVTEIDTLVEKIVLEKMNRDFPNALFFGEETGYDNAQLPSSCWLIDPIDGTKSYIENSGTFTCMAVLIQNNEAQACIIYNPTTDDTYTAVNEGGAFKNGSLLDLKNTQYPKVGLCKGRFVHDLNLLFTPETGIEHQTGPVGAGHGFAMVAEGSAASVFKMIAKGYIHDYATGALLVKEAGGAILPILETVYSFRTRSFVACHPEIEHIIQAKMETIKLLEDPTMTAL